MIQATIDGDLATSGSTEGMTGGMDFGFLKDEMMAVIDADCDHSMILWDKDPLLKLFIENYDAFERDYMTQRSYMITRENQYAILTDNKLHKYWSLCGKLYIMDKVPTAENLANHWYGRLAPRLHARSQGACWLTKLRVYETPNCFAEVTE